MKLNSKRFPLTGKQRDFLLVIAKLFRDIFLLHMQDSLQQLEGLGITCAANKNNYANLLEEYKYYIQKNPSGF